jgi:hypothetical protein
VMKYWQTFYNINLQSDSTRSKMNKIIDELDLSLVYLFKIGIPMLPVGSVMPSKLHIVAAISTM